ncbi:MAG TPA: hypothetical protein VF070_13630 [Streptosporangiaceae bacterium]
MIHIRYKNLSPGMHAEAECGLRGIVVYLLPGLTSAQRKAALRRLRQEGSRGCGPRLPSAQLAAALAVDRIRSAVGNTAAAVRQHPIGTLLPATLAGALLAAFVVTSMSVRMSHEPVSDSPGAASWSVPAGTPGQGGPPARVQSNALGVGSSSGVSLSGGPEPDGTATGIHPGTTWAATGAGPAAYAGAVIAALNTPTASAGHAARRSPAGHDEPAGPTTATGQGASTGQYAPAGQSWPATRSAPGKGGGASTSAQPTSSASPTQQAPTSQAPTRPAQGPPSSTATSQPSAAPTGQSASGAGSAQSSPAPEPVTQPGG